MAARKPQKTESEIVLEEEQKPEVNFITDPVSFVQKQPKTRDEVAVRDAVRHALKGIENAVSDFIEEKKSEDFSMDDLNELYAVELPLTLAYTSENGRVRVSYDASIIERAA